MSKIPIREYLDGYGDGIHGTPVYADEGEYYFVNGNNIKDGKIIVDNNTLKISKQEYEKIKRPLNENSLLISINGTLGNIGVYKGEKIALGKSACYLNVKDNCNKYFVKYLLSTKEFQKYIMLVAHGSTIKNLAPSQIADYVPELPDDINVDKIASLLKSVDDKIESNKQIINTLEQMAKTLYDYWFVQFDFPDANGRPYKTSGGKMEWNETLSREIPAGWSVRKLTDYVDIIDCLHSKKPDFNYENERYYLLQLENLIDNGLIDTQRKYYVTKSDYEEWTSKIEVHEGDLLVTNAGRVGNVYRVPLNCISGIGRNITALRPQNIPPYFFYYYMIGKDAEQQIRQNTDLGAFFKSLNVKGIKSLNIVVPPQEILMQYECQVKYLRRKIEKCHEENQDLISIQDFLLPMLMNGQVTFRQ